MLIVLAAAVIGFMFLRRSQSTAQATEAAVEKQLAAQSNEEMDVPEGSENPTSDEVAAVDTNSETQNWQNFEKPNDTVLRAALTASQYRITQRDGTEIPFQNEYWDTKAEGIYVDVVSGEPLFSSVDKYKSGTGWPSFTKPLSPENIVTRSDTLLGYERIEVRSRYGDSHLGHVFNDGPTTLQASGGAEPSGLRYCLNSAALRFVPRAEMEGEGYGDYLIIFQ